MKPCNIDNSRKMPSNATIFDDLSDDVLGNILLFCPFPSAVQLVRGTCKNLRHRAPQLSQVWKEIYDLRGFFPPEVEYAETDYLMLGKKKCQFLSNAMQKSKCDHVTRQRSIISIPMDHRSRFTSVGHFARRTWRSFRDRTRHRPPILKAFNPRHGFFPRDERLDSSSYLMWLGQRHLDLSDAVLQDEISNSEIQQYPALPDHYFHFMPILPPLTFSVHDNNSTMMIPPPQFHNYASFALIGGGTSPELLLLDPFDGSLSVFEDCCRQAKKFDTHTSSSSRDSNKVSNEDADTINGSQYQHLDPPMQCLLQGNEFSEVDLIANYFPHSDRGLITENFDADYGGIDATPIWRDSNFKSYQLEGYMVGVVRCIRNLDNDSVVCTEFCTWTRSRSKEKKFENLRLCRFPFIFDEVEVDACHLRLLVSHVSEIEGSDRIISVYPLIDWKEENVGANLYFPKSLFSIDCQGVIDTFSLDATGQTLLVATRSGGIEIWMLGLENAHRQQVLHLLAQPSWTVELEMTRQFFRARRDGNAEFATFTNENGEEYVETPVFPAFNPGINSILVPNNLPVQRSGFLTLHDNRGDGRSLLLWKSVEASWQVVALIHLDLFRRPRPWITYDGHRIIVFGEDHIGPVILIYQVLNSANVADNAGHSRPGEAFEGGVYSMVKAPTVRLANQIRHVALGGIEASDTLHMTCNERFIIVNTRKGNQLGTSPFRNGLLIIDLEDQ